MKMTNNKWDHSDDCLHTSPLPTGEGYWHCTCGYDAYEEAQEDAEGADTLRTENARLDAALADTAAQLVDAVERVEAAEVELAKFRIVTVARRSGGNLIACDGDGSGPGCEYDAEWEVQAMDAEGSHYTHLCSYHLNDYQKWAADDGRLPMTFEAE